MACTRITGKIWKEMLQRFENFLFDADGVLWNGNLPIEGSKEFVQNLVNMGKRICMVTNNSSKSRLQYQEKCAKLGFPAFVEENIVTTSAVAAEYLRSMGFLGKMYVVGCRGIGAEFDKVGIPHIGIGADHLETYVDDSEDMIFSVPLDPEVRGVTIGFDSRFSYIKSMKASSYLKRAESVFLATNDDESVPSADPTFVLPGTGSIVISVKEASGRVPVVLGKPHTPMFNYVQSLLPGMEPARTLMFGDRCRTDIQFAYNHGLTSVFLLSGDTSMAMVEEYGKSGHRELVPDFYAEDLGVLMRL